MIVTTLRVVKDTAGHSFEAVFSTIAGALLLATIAGTFGSVFGLVIWAFKRPKLTLSTTCGGATLIFLMATSVLVVVQA